MDSTAYGLGDAARRERPGKHFLIPCPIASHSSWLLTGGSSMCSATIWTAVGACRVSAAGARPTPTPCAGLHGFFRNRPASGASPFTRKFPMSWKMSQLAYSKRGKCLRRKSPKV